MCRIAGSRGIPEGTLGTGELLGWEAQLPESLGTVRGEDGEVGQLEKGVLKTVLPGVGRNKVCCIPVLPCRFR